MHNRGPQVAYTVETETELYIYNRLVTCGIVMHLHSSSIDSGVRGIGNGSRVPYPAIHSVYVLKQFVLFPGPAHHSVT